MEIHKWICGGPQVENEVYIYIYRVNEANSGMACGDVEGKTENACLIHAGVMTSLPLSP